MKINFIYFAFFILLMVFMFSDMSLSQVSDIDNNTYKTVKLGNQVWMAENLTTQHYRNGDIIPQVQNSEEWINLTIGAWCYYYNKTEHGVVYGKLYNWYAVTDPRGLAPEGWHIPDKPEWQTLEGFLDHDVAGKKMKSITGWEEDAEVSTNESEFNGLPGGYRSGWKKANIKGEFFNMGKNGDWWTTTAIDDEILWDANLDAYSNQLGFWKMYKTAGLAVRCIKD